MWSCGSDSAGRNGITPNASEPSRIVPAISQRGADSAKQPQRHRGRRDAAEKGGESQAEQADPAERHAPGADRAGVQEVGLTVLEGHQQLPSGEDGGRHRGGEQTPAEAAQRPARRPAELRPR